jgi:hypothetical protein
VYIGLVASLTIDDQKEQFIEKKIEHDKWERLPPSWREEERTLLTELGL